MITKEIKAIDQSKFDPKEMKKLQKAQKWFNDMVKRGLIKKRENQLASVAERHKIRRTFNQANKL